MNDDDRRPNWDKWAHIPDLKVWQAVALSLDIDPDKASYDYDWKVEGYGSGEGQKFGDRVDIATANINKSGGLTAVQLNLADPSEHKVSLAHFAAWAQALGWTVPAGLAACASDRYATGSRPEIDVEGWKRRRLWTLLEAAYLIGGYLPEMHAVMMANVLAARMGGGTDAASSRAEIYNDLKDAIDLHEIEYVESRTSDLSGRRVKPGDCMQWAKARGYKVPKSLSDLAISPVPAKKQGRDELSGKERMTAYKLVLGMAMAAFGFDPTANKSDTANRISAALQTVGIRLTDETVHKWLRAAAAQVDTSE